MANRDLTIVVVDDNEAVLTIICETLIADGYENTYGFVDPFQARDFLTGKKVNALITDYDMPGLNGLQLVDLVPDIPNKIMVSGLLPNDSNLQLQCQRRGILPIAKFGSTDQLAVLLAKIRSIQ